MRYHSLNTLIRMVLDEHPDWCAEHARERAVVVRRELSRLDKAWYRSNQRFREHNLLLGDAIDDPGYEAEPDEPEVAAGAY